MPLPLAAGLALGSLLGGGTQQTQTTNLSSSITNSFNPNITFGGSTNFSPSVPNSSDFDQTTSNVSTQEQANPNDLLSLLNPATAATSAITGIASGIAGTQSTPSLSSLGLSEADLFGTAEQAGFPIELVALGVGAIALLALFAKPREEG